MVSSTFTAVALLGSGSLAADDGGRGRLLVVTVAILVVAGFVLHRIVVPLVRVLIRLLE